MLHSFQVMHQIIPTHIYIQYVNIPEIAMMISFKKY